jgi:hypothetical protein
MANYLIMSQSNVYRISKIKYMEFLRDYSLGQKPKMEEYGEIIGSLHQKQLWGITRGRAKELLEEERRSYLQTEENYRPSPEAEIKGRLKTLSFEESHKGYGPTIDLEDPFLDEEPEDPFLTR